MDFSNLRDQVSNLTMYDLKAGVRKVQNVVMNYTEMEGKVREATNNEPWGASSTLMQEIANATYNYQQLNEIMPMIYKRFTEKAVEEWRQIYKALQLLEFLVKNGSERVIDDARSHLSLLKMLRQFHYIDPNGKDQGINVRNRAKELAELLSDVDRIRMERKKSRSTRNKYGGYEGSSASMGTGSSRYGGFGSGSAAGFGGYSGGVYGDGGGFGGNAESFDDIAPRGDRFEEYNEYDEGAVAAPGRRKADMPSASQVRREAAAKAEPPKKKEPEVDLFSFGDDDVSQPAAQPSTIANGKKPAINDTFGSLQSAAADDDDFDDFQSAAPPSQTAPQPSLSNIHPPASTSTTTASTQFAAPKPVSVSQGTNINDLVGFASISPAASNTNTPSNTSAFSPPSLAASQAQTAPRPTGYQAAQPNYFTSVTANTSQQPQLGRSLSSTSSLHSATTSANNPLSAQPASKPAPTGDVFGSLWSSASAGIKKPSTSGQQGPNLASMAKEKASAGIWGASPAGSTVSSPQKPRAPPAGASANQPAAGQKLGGGLDDLLG
ncbi:ENTH-domain-containing protein [Xylona heveae TC161]|uniref:ENTH-domain-containing protein n=1 Tax=Xylona heveae (strain CBS 132557 / TC161) TaxID=1328760 RepID=A0A165I5D3_XYLHT|nr:ENTH-domain-containing protein [Xylona heveae TC161]KZF24410.1 ENTH-domain-containing protein [Xylona heveae TC161]